MRILVGGGAGFIGSVLVPLLQEHGYEVDVADLLWFGNHLPDGSKVIERDLFELREEDMAGYEQVIFLAGLSNDPMAAYDPARNFVENGALPSYLAFVAKNAGVRRFIYASSCSVYGYSVDQLSNEESPATCSFPYGISKLQGERGVFQLGDDRFSTIALRQGTVCGHSSRSRFDLIVNTMFKSAIVDGRITVNNPAIWRPVLDVRDTSAAFLRAVQADYGLSGAFNVAFDNFTVGQIADTVKEEVERLLGKKISITINNVQDYRNYKVSSDKARSQLGFLPKYSISDIVNSLHDHLAEYGDFSNDLFYNINTFKNLVESQRATIP